MNIIHEISSEGEKERFFKSNPSSLFKYRSWNNDYHKLLVTKQELYFSSPEKFNDPYDCGLPFKQHPDNTDPIKIKQKIEETAAKLFPGISGTELEEKCAKQVLLIQQNPISWFEMNWGYDPSELNSRFGVLSLTPHPNKYLMWSHYAEAHQGFCVEFDTRLLVESIAGHYQKVTYSADIPYFSILDKIEQGLITKLLYTKSNDWGYEDEYRITKIHGANSSAQFNPSALIGIYFGVRMPFEQQVEIVDIAKPLYPNTNFYKMNLGQESFELIKGDLPIF